MCPCHHHRKYGCMWISNFLKLGVFSETYSVLLDGTVSSFMSQWFAVVSFGYATGSFFFKTGSAVTCAMKLLMESVRKHLIR